MNSRSKALEKIDNKIIIDPKMLSKEERRFLIDFIEFLIRKRKEKEIPKKAREPKIKFKDWLLHAKGKLSREEIYDYF